MATTKTNKLLPAVFQSDTNKKFLNATLDQLVTEQSLKVINGYVGRKFAPGFSGIDTYIKEPNLTRADYQLEPSVIYENLVNKELEFASTYPETLQSINYFGGNTANQNNLWSSEYYSYDPKINLDAFINFSQYYYLPLGPDTVTVSAGNVQLDTNYTVSYQSSNKVYNIYGYGTLPNPDLVLVRGGTYTFNVNEKGHKFYIQSDPGISGVQTDNENLSSRQVLGVTNNGTDVGSVIFAVPQKTAQDLYVNMPTVQTIDFVVTQKYSELQGQLLSTIQNGFDGQTIGLDGKYIIFGTYTENVSDWTSGSTVPENQRYGIWQVTLTPAGADFTVSLTYSAAISINNKVFVRAGENYANTEWYKNILNRLELLPVITANKDFLYYQDSVDPTAYGRIRLIDANNPNIDIETDILGKLNYISPNGIIFTNGLKIRFDSTATPISYRDKIYYVEGVGTGIKLVNADLLDIITKDKTSYKVDDNFTFAATASISSDSKSFTIQTTDFPDGETVLTGNFPNNNASNYIVKQNNNLTYPYRGGTNDPGDHDSVTLRTGIIGITLPGIYIYNSYDNLYINGDNESVWHLNGPEVRINGQDVYGGTPKYRYDNQTLQNLNNPGLASAYYYQDSKFITANAWGNVTGFTNGYLHNDGHSKIIGFAADGYPIYGPYGYKDPYNQDTEVIRMRSAYILNVNTTNRPAAQTATVQDSAVNSRVILVDKWNLRVGMRITINSAGITPSTVYITEAYNDALQLNKKIGTNNYYNPNLITLNQAITVNEGDTLTFEFLDGAFIEDYVFMPNYGTLDRYNGRFCITPDFPNGTYAYFATQDATGKPVYPYFIGSAFYGDLTPDSNFNIDDIDYITINRASRDLNAWTVRNKWFHQYVIEISAAYNNKTVSFQADQRAKRPIIEFLPDLQLINFGKIGLEPVDFYDVSTRIPLQAVEGKIGYYADGKFLFDGAKIVFPNATDLNQRNKIYLVSYINPTGNSSIIHLEEYATAVENNTINVKSGLNYGGQSFYFNGISWRAGQQKSSINQAPYFDIIDSDDVSYSNIEKYPIVGTDTKFIGSKIFNYKLNDLTVNDPVLGLPISYRSITNVGDIEFSNYYDTDTFVYTISNVPVTKKVNTGYICRNNADGSITKLNVWTKAVENSKQYQYFSFNYDGINNNFTIDIIPEVSTIVPNIRVFVNFVPVPVNKFSLYNIPNNKVLIKIDPDIIKDNDRIDIQVFSNGVSTTGFYQVPNNLNYNSQNELIESLTLGSFRNHILVLTQNSTLFTGSFPGTSNLRDINIVAQGGTILQQSAPTIYSTMFLNNPKYDFVKSVNYAQQEYTRFKNKFLNTAINLGNVNYTDIINNVDNILKRINSVKNNTFPWYYSDLIPYGENKTILTYVVLDTLQKNYELTNIFTLNTPSNKAVNVYLNNIQLYHGIDYTFQSSIPAITLNDSLNIAVDDVITIYEYSDTDGCYVPETPTKLGLYPKFKPEIFTDSTYLIPKQFIRGHDGSLTPVFNDYRDSLLLELEKRIYNNIKNEYDPTAINIYDVIPGKFRVTGISLAEFNSLLGRNYLQWVGSNNLDYVSNNIYDSDNTFTYNYANSPDKVDLDLLPGSWRACYRYFYDTENPNTRPWEMLGFSVEPSWWQDTYGPAPYTSGNTLMWQDISQGIIKYGDRAGIDSKFIRPNLLTFLPVDVNGNLVTPLGLLTQDFDSSGFGNNWSIGQLGPTENAWRNSSEYAFSLQLVLALTQPAKYFSLGILRNKYNYDSILDQYLVSDTNYRLTPDDLDINGYKDINGNISRVVSYTNWISDYQTANGITNKTEFLNYLKYFKVNLSYRVAGFTSKQNIKVLAEQFSPNSINESIIIPDADFKIDLHKSTPLAKIRYSAVIIEKTVSGFKITGYDSNYPYFTLCPPNLNGLSETVSVLNRSATFYNTGLPTRINITYGTILETAQQVVSFLSGYSFYLKTQGFKFEYFDTNLNKIRDWKLAAEEFLFWIQQGWGSGTTIVLSPVAGKLEYGLRNAIVDEIKGAYNGSRVLNQNGNSLGPDAFKIVRDNNDFSLTLNNLNGELIGLADLDLVQYEHIIVFNNKTQFNDIIYEPASGARQFRLRLVGSKTDNWQGSLAAPGFVYSNGIIDNWRANTDYLKSDLVQYKNFYYAAKENISGQAKFNFSDWEPVSRDKIQEGLINNFALNASVFENFYNVNTINLENQFDLFGLSLIGYKNRNYLNNVGFNDATQVKLYQGFIKNKGTKNATNSFQNILVSNEDKSLNFEEDWAFRVGSYGSLDTNQYIEINLNEDYVLNNPTSVQIHANSYVTFANIRTVDDNIYKSTSIPQQANIFLARSNTSSYTDDIKTAGFVNIEDIDFTVFDINDPVELIQNINKIGVDKKVWVAKDFNQDWNVFTVSRSPSAAAVTNITRELNNSNKTQFLVTTNRPHFLNVGDIAIIIPEGQDNQYLASVYKVTNIPTTDLRTFVAEADIDETSVNLYSSLSINATLFTLVSIKLSYASQLLEYTPAWTVNSKIWVSEYNSDGWAVYNKSEPWQSNLRLTIDPTDSNARLGQTIAVSKDESFVIVGQPGFQSNQGAVLTLTTDSTGAMVENSLLQSTVNNADLFGTSVTAGNVYFAVGSPGTESNIGHVEIYSKSFLGVSALAKVLYPNTANAISFGKTISMSQDDNWLYVAAPEGDKVYVYQFVSTIPVEIDTLVANGVANSFTLDFTTYSPDSVTISNVSNGLLRTLLPYKDYTINGNLVTFTAIPEAGGITVQQGPGFIYANTIVSATANVKFGQSISTSIDGRQIVIGAPETDITTGNTTITNSGAIDVYDRSIERFIANGTQTAFTTIYPINANNTVYLNGELASNFSFTGSNTITFNTAPVNRSLVEIESNHFNKIQTFNANILEKDQKFGYSVDICISSCSVYAGAPYQSNPYTAAYESGAVYTFINQGKVYGEITGTKANANVTIGQSIRINDFTVTFSGTTLSNVISDINSLNIPGIVAANIGSKIQITANSTVSNDQLRILPGIGTGLADLGLEVFTLTQLLTHPKNKAYEYFGQTVKRAYTSSILAISSKDASSDLRMTFDTTNISDTTFDADSTRFVDPGNGAAWIYNYLPDSRNNISNPGIYYFVQYLLPKTNSGASYLLPFTKFGSDILISSKYALVGALEDSTFLNKSGRIYKFINENNQIGWDIIRQQGVKVDIDSILKTYVYSIKSGNILYNLDYIDPAKGKILGAAEQELTYKTDYDPAVYNFGNTNDINVVLNDKIYWSEQQVGQVWWDLSTLRYIDYEQGSIGYRATNWGGVFPGSSIDVYEWVESIYPPSQYTNNNGNGIPKYPDNSAYVAITYVDTGTNSPVVKYYFWVKNKTEINEKYKNRSLPIATVASYITDPKNSGIKYFAPLALDAVSVYNVNNDLSGKDRVLHIDYATKFSENLLHNEFQLVSEEASNVNAIPEALLNKLKDSVSRIDSKGLTVPDPELKPQNKYGISIRPRQSIFVNQTSAVKELVMFSNSIFARNIMAQGFDLTGISAAEEIPITNPAAYNLTVNSYDELIFLNIRTYTVGFKVLVLNDETAAGLWTIYTKQVNETWKLTRVQSYDTSEYWEYSDWYAEGYDNTIQPTYTVNSIIDIANLALKSEDIVKIKNSGQGKWSIIQVWPTFIKTVGIQDGTVQFKESLYNLPEYFMGFSNERFSVDRFDHNPNIELRKIFEALQNNLFINQLSQEFVNLFFVLIKYAIAEQKNIDWVFKTSLVKLNQVNNNLGQPTIYSKPSTTLFEEYFKEIKPFRTLIREFINSYKINDNLNGYVSDFDVPGIYDPVLRLYRSPSGEYSQDASLLKEPQYFDWLNAYKYYVSGMLIENGGSGYTEPPVITITGSQINDNARAEAILTNGIITKINVLYPGSAYITQPTISISGGNGTGAKLYALLTNNAIRKIKTTLVYDRITYNTDLIDWEPETNYTLGQTIVYQNNAYKVNYNFTSGLLFSAESTPDGQANPLLLLNQNALEDANDKITAFYTPTNLMTGKVLSSLQTGINYPGVIVEGMAYHESGGFDISEFDSYLFDSVDHDEYGTPIVSDVQLDSIIESDYTDIYLGQSAEDIIIDGAAYVDRYSSYGPEELIPGRVFDTLDMTITTFATNAASSSYSSWVSTTAFEVSELIILDGGEGYSANSTFYLTFTSPSGSGANASVTTDSNGTIISANLIGNGSGYTTIPNVAVTESNTSPAIVVARISQNTYDTFGYRIFKDKNDNYQYLRVLDTSNTTLTANVTLTANSIVVANSAVLPMPAPNSNIICSVTINGERIIYFSKNDATNTLSNLIRGAYGTGANAHTIGMDVIDSSYTQIVPTSSNYTWTPNTNITLMSVVREFNTFYANTTYIRSNAWIDIGRVEPIITENALFNLATEDDKSMVTEESKEVDAFGLFVSSKTPAVFVRQI